MYQLITRKLIKLLGVSLILSLTGCLSITTNPKTTPVKLEEKSTVSPKPTQTPLPPQIASSISDESGYKIDVSRVNDPQWLEAISLANQRPDLASGRGFVTLVRIFWQDAKPGETIQLVSGKLNELKSSTTGGGRYLQVPNGGFFIIEHIPPHPSNNKDELEVGAYFHHKPTIMVDIPPIGQLGILGDLTLNWAGSSEVGALIIKVNKPLDKEIKLTKIRLGPAIVGGPYGLDFKLDNNHQVVIKNLSAGTYKLLFPEFNYQKSRWTVEVFPQKATLLEFSAHNQTLIEKVQESQGIAD